MAGTALVPVNKPPVPKTVYRQDAVEEILERYAGGETVLSICRDPSVGIRESTFRLWIIYDGAGQAAGKPWEGLAALYARARTMHLEHELEDLREIADTQLEAEERTLKIDGDSRELTIKTKDAVAHRALQVDARKWRIAKIGWREYGVKPGAAPDAAGPGDAAPSIKVNGGLPDE